MTEEDKVIPINVETIEEATVEQEHKHPITEEVDQMLAKIEFKPSALVWKNFRKEQPDIDRWFVLWCPMGKVAQNVFISYRDALGNYDLPHPTKRYNAHAWAYIDNPEVTQQSTVQ